MWRTERQWMSRIDHMVGSTLGEEDLTRYGQGLLSFRASTFRFGRQDRDDLLAYVVSNFGPDSEPRRVRIEQQTPIDEESLSKAMYIAVRSRRPSTRSRSARPCTSSTPCPRMAREKATMIRSGPGMG